MNYKNYKIKIVADESPVNPRDNDNLSKFYFFGGMKGYGDAHDLPDPRELGISTVAEHADWFKRNLGGAILPIYGYSHSGVTFSTKPFSCKFDSGCAGFAVVAFDTIQKEFNPEKETVESVIQKCAQNIIAEVETLNKYLNGGFCGYEILDGDAEVVASCYGYESEDDALEDAKAEIDTAEAEQMKQRKVATPPPQGVPAGSKLVNLADLLAGSDNPEARNIMELLSKIMGRTPMAGKPVTPPAPVVPPKPPVVQPTPKTAPSMLAPTPQGTQVKTFGSMAELIEFVNGMKKGTQPAGFEKLMKPEAPAPQTPKSPCSSCGTSCKPTVVPLVGKPVPTPMPKVVEKVVPKVPTIEDKIKSLLINPKTGKPYSRRSLQRGKQLQKITNEVKKYVLTLVK
jgi:hypothetical protein